MIADTATLPERTLERIAERLRARVREDAPDVEVAVVFDAPRRREFGDFSTNVAFTLAKVRRAAPARIAEDLCAALAADEVAGPLLESVAAEAGFINIRLAKDVWRAALAELLAAGESYGRGRLADAPATNLEFGSANPTGPVVVVQGRTLSIGGTLAAALRHCGVPLTVEWFINDAGNQLETFGRSIYARYRQTTDEAYPFPETGYRGEYVAPLAAALRERDGARWETAPEAEWLPVFARFGRDTMVAEQQATCERFGVRFDRWQSERELHEAGAVERGIEALRSAGLTYEADGALWFSAVRFGDDKDRVLRRSTGTHTYYAGDVAYHADKYARGAERVIDILGPDHHGYIGRLQALASALGHPGTLEVVIAQQMTLVRGGEQAKLSKRAGNVLTLADVIDEIGVDAARFFFILSSTDSPLTIDLELAVQKGEENPVYYVQYGHARISSLLRKAPPEIAALERPDFGLLAQPGELQLIRRLAEFPALVAAVATHRAPHRLAKYARDVATDFHQMYAESRILGDDVALSAARLALARAARGILALVLGLCGVSAPESM